jgi:hypothetical protein
MAAGLTFAPIRGKRMRITRLDECGAPVVGPATTRVSKGFVSVGLSPQYEDGETVTIKDADGDIDINEPADSRLTAMSAEIAFTRVDPDLVSLITGNQTIVDAAARGVGFRMDGGIPVLGGWALEVWTGIGGQECAGLANFGYTLLPFLRGGKIGDFTIEDGAASFSISSTTRENSQWGAGPYDVVHTVAGANGGAPTVPGPLLTEVGPKTHFHLQITSVAPPEVTEGLVALAAA